MRFSRREERIISVVCNAYNVKREQIFSRSRLRKHVEPRFVIAYLFWKAGSSKNKIGRKLDRGHSDIIYAIRTIEGLNETGQIKFKLEYFNQKIKGNDKNFKGRKKEHSGT